MTYFANITIQEKSGKGDFRSFCSCRDNDGNEWEIRGYGSTAGEAANDAYQRYQDNENWDVYGYIIKEKTEQVSNID